MQMGVPLPPPGEPLPEDAEVQLSQLVAQASSQVLQIHKSQVAQEQAQEQAQDPIVQMQQQELAIKQAEQQRKAKKDAADIALKQSQQQIERERIAAQSRDSDKRLVADALHKKADIAQETRAHHKDLLLDATKTILQNSKKGE